MGDHNPEKLEIICNSDFLKEHMDLSELNGYIQAHSELILGDFRYDWQRRKLEHDLAEYLWESGPKTFNDFMKAAPGRAQVAVRVEDDGTNTLIKIILIDMHSMFEPETYRSN